MDKVREHMESYHDGVAAGMEIALRFIKEARQDPDLDTGIMVETLENYLAEFKRQRYSIPEV